MMEERIKLLEDRLNMLEKSDRYTVQKTIQMLDGRYIQIGITKGTSLGTTATQKLSFYGVTPVVQAASITAPSGGSSVDTGARTAIASIITALKNIGITA